MADRQEAVKQVDCPEHVRAQRSRELERIFGIRYSPEVAKRWAEGIVSFFPDPEGAWKIEEVREDWRSALRVEVGGEEVILVFGRNLLIGTKDYPGFLELTYPLSRCSYVMDASKSETLTLGNLNGQEIKFTRDSEGSEGVSLIGLADFKE